MRERLRNGRIWGAWLLCLCLIASAASLHARAAQADSGELLVWLKSLGAPTQMTLTLAGSYSVEGDVGFQFERGTVINASVADGHLLLRVGGLTLDMGAAFTLTRHQAEGENGLYIEGSPRGGLYCGDLTLTNEAGGIRATLAIDIEEYLLGVVPYEMSDSFPLEALKAQAVAARTYALNRRTARAQGQHHVVDTTADQVYMGYDASYVNAVTAVEATRGVVGLYRGDYASCFYTASNGGQTALPGDIFSGDGDFDYLGIYDDPYDLENSRSVVKSLSFLSDASDLGDALATMLKSGLTEELASLGFSDELADIAIDQIVAVVPHAPKLRDEYRMYEQLRFDLRVRARPLQPIYGRLTIRECIDAAREGRAPVPAITGWTLGEAQALAQTFSVHLSVYDQVKNGLGLSINGMDTELVSVVQEAAGNAMRYTIQMRRYGHGVGMSQRGAQWMAGQYGHNFLEILAFYYPGLAFETRSFASTVRPPLAAGQTGLGASRVRATPLPTPAPLPPLEEGEFYATATLSTAWSTLNVRAQPSTSAQVVGELRSGERMIVTDEVYDGWLQIRTATLTGYVSKAYVTITRE